MRDKPIASLSLDLDNKWSYLKTHGDPGWESFPSYLDLVVPRFLDLLDELELRITVFVVGQDAALEKNRNALRRIADRGHEIGNHSFNHEPWLHLYTPDQLSREFEMSEEVIEQATGQRTIGFRGPGFSLSDQTLKILVQRGYLYDCSTFPTFLGPLARAYYFMSAKLTQQQQEDRKVLFGRFSDGFQSNRPFYWDAGAQRILEIPVTTFPMVKTPFHASYLLYLSTYSTIAMRAYLWSAIRACRTTGVAPSFLLHPLDFMGEDDDRDLSFFPAMNRPAAQKCELMKSILSKLKDNFQFLTMRQHAQHPSCQQLRDRPIQLARSGVT